MSNLDKYMEWVEILSHPRPFPSNDGWIDKKSTDTWLPFVLEVYQYEENFWPEPDLGWSYWRGLGINWRNESVELDIGFDCDGKRLQGHVDIYGTPTLWLPEDPYHIKPKELAALVSYLFK